MKKKRGRNSSLENRDPTWLAVFGCSNPRFIGPVEKIIPVNYYIPGCPPRPEAIIYGVAVALGLVEKKTAPIQLKQLEYPIPQYHPSDLHVRDELVVYEKLEKI